MKKLDVFIKGWNPMRILRLGLGIAAGVQGIVMKDSFAGFAGLLLVGTALFNIGCCAGNCSSGSCDVPRNRNSR